MIIKEVKQYSNRQRIDINKNDGLTPGSEVVILTTNEYENIKQNLMDLNNKLTSKDSELQVMKNQEQNLKEIISDAITPIDEHYQKELSNKDKQINQLQMQLKALQVKTNQYNLDMQGLNVFDIAIFRKHKKLIQNFNDDIALVEVDRKIVDADAKAIPGNDKQEQ